MERDLIARLRAAAHRLEEASSPSLTAVWFRDAADEIERLRAALEQIDKFPTEIYSVREHIHRDMQGIARAALDAQP